MEIFETSIFTQAVSSILADGDYKRLQKSLVFRPAAGKLIPKGGGLRKLRWNVGKTEGLRLIYLFESRRKAVHMIWIYRKSKQEDFTPDQLKALAKTVRENL